MPASRIPARNVRRSSRLYWLVNVAFAAGLLLLFIGCSGSQTSPSGPSSETVTLSAFVELHLSVVLDPRTMPSGSAVMLMVGRADRPDTTFRAWMRGIARHKLHDYLKHRGEPAVGGTDAQIQLQQLPARRRIAGSRLRQKHFGNLIGPRHRRLSPVKFQPRISSIATNNLTTEGSERHGKGF